MTNLFPASAPAARWTVLPLAALAAFSSPASGNAPAASRIVPHGAFGTLSLQADLTGDGKAETIRIVRILPRTAGRATLPDVVIANPWDADRAQVEDGGSDMALTIGNSGPPSKPWLLHSDYVALAAEMMEGAPVTTASKTSRTAKAFRRDCPDLRHDLLVMPTPAGIDIAIYWADNRYKVCWPNETP